ncbi:dynein regulatory complex subunit 7 [Limanda limanda]|uniref:dynein regulatory complex subunit 7 n=1 Tax=Limanda limanda TaxID=27771 RepID=UPI0029C75DBD|nr:dynein regulatory complex subunit 7 [Limanda limanda]
MKTVVESEEEEQQPTRDPEEEEEEDRELERTFRNTQVSAPRQLLLSLNMADSSSPESHRTNSAAQIRLLSFANNFQRQFSHLSPGRRPLLLGPINEFGVQKFVSTTLRATATVQPELFTWGGCAEFVASFLSLEPLDSPVDLPSYLFSPASVLATQRATCFEFATLLCSLLLGVNYDAYCVSGYADREMCLLDQSLQHCPLLDTPVQSVISEESQENKYKEKPQRSLKSHFMTQEDQKKEPSAEAALLENLKPDEPSEQRPADRLRGLRLHCWVLLLAGSRSVQENFFIDPLTGLSYSTGSAHFLGIESVWNNHNYYVNMQDCGSGCSEMVYDLEDVNMWEPLLFGATCKKQLIHEVLNKKLHKMSQDEELEELEEQAFEMPRSWVSDISITKKDLETRWPGGHKLTRYRKAELERFAPYLRPNGLITRLVSYKDLDCKEVLMVKEWYQHRTDHLEEREVNKVDNVTTERFKRGRRFDLLFHRYESLSTDGVHEMKFCSIRVDNLVQRLVSPGEMTETFQRRADSLYYRRVNFGRHVQFTEEHVNSEPATRLIQVVERFHRNCSKPANEDVAERIFLLAERRIEVTYHLDADTFIPSNRSFIKPREATEQKKAEDFTQDMVSSFMVGLSDTPVKTLVLYEMLVSLMKDEEMVVHQIEESLKEVRDIVSCREEEEGDIQLVFCPWTTTGAARARSKRQEMERQAAEEQSWLHENEKDILAPLLMRLDFTDPLSADDAKELHQECLSEFKQKLVEDANLIQERYQNETQELQKKQQWYQQNQLDMTEQQEDEYQTYCSDRTRQIRVAMRRLKMHQEEAPLKYRALDERLREDPRLAPHLLS